MQGAYDTLVRQDGLTTSAAKACPSGSATVALSVMPVMLSLYRPAGQYLCPWQPAAEDVCEPAASQTNNASKHQRRNSKGFVD